MKNLQFDTFLCKIHGIVAEIYANTPNIALARFIFPPPFIGFLMMWSWGTDDVAVNWTDDYGEPLLM